MNQQFLLENKFLHEVFSKYYSTNYIIYYIITFIFVKIIKRQIIFLSW